MVSGIGFDSVFSTREKMSGKKSRSNKIQLRMLVDFMSTHNHLATGEFTGPLGAKRGNSQWQILKDLLKKYGPDRTVDQWKQTWKDLKKAARTENAMANRGCSATGNVSVVPPVTEMSTKVLNIIGHECSTGIGPEESEIGETDEIFEVLVVDDETSSLTTPFTLPSPTSFTHNLENIPPAPSTPNTSNTAPTTSHSAPTTSHPTPSTSHPTRSTSNPTAQRKERPYESFNRLQHENNAILQGIDERIAAQNNLLREQNQLLRAQNTILSQSNKLKRWKRFSRRF